MSNKINLVVITPFVPPGAAAALNPGDLYDYQGKSPSTVLSLIDGGHLQIGLNGTDDPVTANAERAEREQAFRADLRAQIEARRVDAEKQRQEAEAAAALASDPKKLREELKKEILAELKADAKGSPKPSKKTAGADPF